MTRKTRPAARSLPRWLAASAAAATLAVALATAQPAPPPVGEEPVVTHASIVDQFFRVFREYLNWDGPSDDPPADPRLGW
ncbi:MAG: hypothetical protein AAGI17_04955 [Planctomycetota bacterium]